MTKKGIENIILRGSNNGDSIGEIATQILSVIDSEKMGEVVIGFAGNSIITIDEIGLQMPKQLWGKRGQLIFREDK